jgi:hypothetical protein
MRVAFQQLQQSDKNAWLLNDVSAHDSRDLVVNLDFIILHDFNRLGETL